jgi:hypothetical protein
VESIAADESSEGAGAQRESMQIPEVSRAMLD